ncbi:Hypothetical predicted protein [Octopus vulgaris]|uniref:Uncharacterized protein n=1 Tax=Octopus vulgaris TaxID=6645 RepID=A0AA36FMQ4_OCTVU|nr:Hypothetical predicted protein [Octopus vulgaris]
MKRYNSVFKHGTLMNLFSTDVIHIRVMKGIHEKQKARNKRNKEHQMSSVRKDDTQSNLSSDINHNVTVNLAEGHNRPIFIQTKSC